MIWPDVSPKHSRSHRAAFALLALAFSSASTACLEFEDDSARQCDQATSACPGGETTVFDVSNRAFGRPARNLGEDQRERFEQGRALFHSPAVPGESPFPSPFFFQGLGPHFNDTSCGGCHALDGRANPYRTSDEQPTPAILIRVSRLDERGRAHPLEHYGSQLQPLANDGVVLEARVSVSWSFEQGTFEQDGEAFELARPHFSFDDFAHGEPPQGFVHSARATPAMIGLGLLEAVPASTILALADPEDSDGDGISGRPNIVRDPQTGRRLVGRFGWKGSHATLSAQNAAALVGDLGVVTDRAQVECASMTPESTCAEVDGQQLAAIEASPEQLEAMNFYTRHLAVPAKREIAEDVGFPGLETLGEELFERSQCASCHTPSMQTASNYFEPALSDQTIFAYTDLLLHDMGEGLADGRPDGEATGREWRTPPLWGLGMMFTVNGHTRLLHDGRARTISEAILWHGGEAQGARDAFLNMTFNEREALLMFLESL